MTPYYEADGIVIYLGDCREVLPLVAGDCFATDPPYGVGLKARVTKHSVRKGSYTKFEDSPEYVRDVAVGAVRSMLERGWRGAVTPGVRNCFAYPEPEDMGCIFAPAGAGRSRWGFQCMSPILYYGKCPNPRAPSSLTHNSAGEENGHPCPKPLRVMEWLVNRVSFLGECVVDPFMGSGTTLAAAKTLGRRAIGIELEERYCEIAAKRLAQRPLFAVQAHKPQPVLFQESDE